VRNDPAKETLTATMVGLGRYPSWPMAALELPVSVEAAGGAALSKLETAFGSPCASADAVRGRGSPPVHTLGEAVGSSRSVRSFRPQTWQLLRPCWHSFSLQTRGNDPFTINLSTPSHWARGRVRLHLTRQSWELPPRKGGTSMNVLYDLGAALVVALIAIGWLLVRFTAYRARFKFTDVDLKLAREDSKIRSRSIISGKVQEHLAPVFPEFLAQFNPCDGRFLGSPIDYIVFDGLDAGETDLSVVFVEVKTGKGQIWTKDPCCTVPAISATLLGCLGTGTGPRCQRHASLSKRRSRPF
jgi:hypothetical protein